MLAGSPLARWPSQTSIARTAVTGFAASASASVFRNAVFSGAIIRVTALPIAPHKDASASSKIEFLGRGEAQADYFGKVEVTAAFTALPGITRIYRNVIGKNPITFTLAANAEPDRTELFSPAPARIGFKAAASFVGPVGNVFPRMQFTADAVTNVIYEGFADNAPFSVTASATAGKTAKGYANPATSIRLQASAEPAVTRDGVTTKDASGSAGFKVLAHLDKKVISFTYLDVRFGFGATVVPYIIFTDEVLAGVGIGVNVSAQVLRPKNASVASFFGVAADISTVVIQPKISSSIALTARTADPLRVANSTISTTINYTADASSSVVKTPNVQAMVFSMAASSIEGVRIATDSVNANVSIDAVGQGINKPKVIATPKPVNLFFDAVGQAALTQLGSGFARMEITTAASGSLNDLQPAPLWRQIELEETDRGIVLELQDRVIEL